MRSRQGGVRAESTTGRSLAAALAVLLSVMLGGCGRTPGAKVEAEPERLARTEFTERIENFFEYDPLTPGKPSAFLIHLTNLTDGSPVEKARVTLAVRPAGEGAPVTVTARVGRVTGIYVAEVTVPRAATYAIEFHVKNATLDERMPLQGFDAK